MKVYSQKSKRYLSEGGFQFEDIMTKKNDPQEQAKQKMLQNRAKKAKQTKLDTGLI
jgi:glutaredoxin